MKKKQCLGFNQHITSLMPKVKACILGNVKTKVYL